MSKIKKNRKINSKAPQKKSGKISDFESLKQGDVIEIIAPSSSVPIENLAKGIKILESWGYQVQCESHLLDPQIFLANTDKKRFTSFKKAMTNKKSKIIWCLRGGYGAIRLLPEIEKMKIPRHKKILIGLSDISSLHAVINQKWRFPSLHASLLDRLATDRLDSENIFELRQVLENPEFVMLFDKLKALNKAAQNLKLIKSTVVGGNLSVVNSTVGTISQLRTKNKILFLEELNERAYRVDRYLQQMKQAGLFDEVSAVVFGDFTGCDEPNKDNYIHVVLQNFFEKLKIPAFIGIESGHGDKQRPLFFNTEAHLTGGKNPKMLVYSAFQKKSAKDRTLK